MSRYRKLLYLLAFAVICSAATGARAQRFTPFGPLFNDDFHPFGPEGQFSDNYQFFAPANVSPFGGGPDPNVGLFFTYDRLNWSVTRPNSAPGNRQGDWTWGNRFDIGYMTEDDHGWLFEVIHVNGPGFGDANGSIIHISEYSGAELMKQWRLKPLHRGSLIEVFAGMRYALIHQRTNTDSIKNVIVGPQVGLKWYKQKGRWTLSTEGRYYYGYNMQVYEPTGLGPLPLGSEEQRWVFAGDLRLEVAYKFTKAFSLAVGWELLYFGTGIARGNALNDNDQDMYFTGVTFGCKWNR